MRYISIVVFLWVNFTFSIACTKKPASEDIPISNDQPSENPTPSPDSPPVANAVSTPTASPIAGKYLSTQAVTLSTSTGSATIHYTIDGSEPSCLSTLYSNALIASTNATIKALACHQDLAESSVATYSYFINQISGASVEAFPNSAVTSWMPTIIFSITDPDTLSLYSDTSGTAISSATMVSSGHNSLIAYPNTVLGITSHIYAKATTSAYQDLGTFKTKRPLSSPGYAFDDRVLVLAQDHSGNLYAGGYFSYAGGVPANRIAKWNPTTSAWTAIGSGVTGGAYVNAIAFDSNDNLYIGGNFWNAGNTSINYIAKWDGTAWTPLGTGANNQVFALEFDNNNILFAGGMFTSVGGSPNTLNIAKWDGASWSSVGTGTSSTVWTLAKDSNGNIYAGGYFNAASDVPNTSRIAKWNGSSWMSLSTGVNSTVNDIAFDSTGNLFASGNFTTAGGTPANRIAKWNGSAWSALGSGLDGQAVTLTIDETDNVYVGGVFTTAGGVSSNYIAKWDTSSQSWSALGAGLSHQAAFLFAKNNQIYVGGLFSSVDTLARPYLAVYLSKFSSWF